MIIGGQAVLVYGEPRLTKDIDITLGLGSNDYKVILDLVKDLKLKVLVENPKSFVNEFMVLPVLDENSGIKIDFIFSFTLYEQEAIKRSNKIKIREAMVNFASVEDIIIHKVFAGRARDLEDVKNLVLKNPKFDKQYILNCLKEFDVSLSEDFTGKFNKVISEIN